MEENEIFVEELIERLMEYYSRICTWRGGWNASGKGTE